MKLIAIVVFLSVFSALVNAAQPAHPTTLGEGMVNPGYQDKPDWFKASFLDIREDLDEAAETGST